MGIYHNQSKSLPMDSRYFWCALWALVCRENITQVFKVLAFDLGRSVLSIIPKKPQCNPKITLLQPQWVP